MMRLFSVLTFVLLTCSHSQTTYAQEEAATLKLRFVLKGGVEPPPPVIRAVPNIGNLVIRPLKIGKEGGIQDIAVYVYERGTQVELPELPVDKEAVVEIKIAGMQFSPPVIKARVGQTIRVLNQDAGGHNANFNFLKNLPFGPLLTQDGRSEFKIDFAEPAPIEVNCSIHPWMRAYAIITDHPFVGISDEEGAIIIEDLPVGRVTFKAWHRYASKYIDKVEIADKVEEWKRGRFELELKPGENDLGTIVLSPDLF